MNLYTAIPKGLVPVALENQRKISPEDLSAIVKLYPLLAFLEQSDIWTIDTTVSYAKRLDTAYYRQYNAAIPEEMKQTATRMALQSLDSSGTGFVKFRRRLPPYDPYGSCWNRKGHSSYQSMISYFKKQRGYSVTLYRTRDRYPKKMSGRAFLMPIEDQDLFIVHNFQGFSANTMMGVLKAALHMKHTRRIQIDITTQGYLDDEEYAIANHPIEPTRIDLKLR